MWSAIQQEIKKDTVKYTFLFADKPLSNKDVCELWRSSEEFVGFFVEVLKASVFDAFFWEVKPVAWAKMEEEFEFVLVDSPLLSNNQSDSSSFHAYFEENDWVTSFFNLTGDSQLVVPVERSDFRNYAHLAKFVRNAPHVQIEIFWKRVGEEFSKAIGAQDRWLSTSGLGVHWLHVRIDAKPKYYNYIAYKEGSISL